MIGRRGFTLIELLVVLVIVGITYAAVGLAVRSVGDDPHDAIPATVAEARRRAIQTGAAVTVRLAVEDSLTLYPDGSATRVRIRDGKARWEVDPWNAEVRRVE